LPCDPQISPSRQPTPTRAPPSQQAIASDSFRSGHTYSGQASPGPQTGGDGHEQIGGDGIGVGTGVGGLGVGVGGAGVGVGGAGGAGVGVGETTGGWTGAAHIAFGGQQPATRLVPQPVTSRAKSGL
jgi:hypothetical protein